MNTENKKLKIKIFNDQYSLVSDENEQDVVKAASLVNDLMKEISEKSGIGDAKKIAVLAALKVANTLVHLEKNIACYQEKQEKLVELINKEGLSSHS